METNQKAVFHVDAASDWAQASSLTMGIAFFVRALYYFGFVNLHDCRVPELVLQLVFPLVIMAVYFFALRGFKLETSVVFGALAVVCCVVFIIEGFADGMTVGVIGAVWFAAAAVITVLTTIGVLQHRVFMVLIFLLALPAKLFAVDLNKYLIPMEFVEFLPEFSLLCMMLALVFLAPCLKKNEA